MDYIRKGVITEKDEMENSFEWLGLKKKTERRKEDESENVWDGSFGAYFCVYRGLCKQPSYVCSGR
jgi:hypothetical protein